MVKTKALAWVEMKRKYETMIEVMKPRFRSEKGVAITTSDTGNALLTGTAELTRAEVDELVSFLREFFVVAAPEGKAEQVLSAAPQSNGEAKILELVDSLEII